MVGREGVVDQGAEKLGNGLVPLAGELDERLHATGRQEQADLHDVSERGFAALWGTYALKGGHGRVLPLQYRRESSVVGDSPASFEAIVGPIPAIAFNKVPFWLRFFGVVSG